MSLVMHGARCFKMARPIKFRDPWHDKHRAWNTVKWRIRRGRLARASTLKCNDCDKQASEYDHYLGYADENVLKVQPVCKSCHSKRVFRRGERPAARFDNHKKRGAIGPVTKWGHFYSSAARETDGTNARMNRLLIGPRTKDKRFVSAHGRERV